MNTIRKQAYLKTILLLFICMTTITMSSAYNGDEKEKESAVKVKKKKGAFGETVTRTGTNNNALKGQYRTAKLIRGDFTGYTVQIRSSMDKLDVNDNVFAEFGQVMVEENSNPRYIYFIGQFKSHDNAIAYMKNIIGVRYQAAKIIQFKNGKRLNTLQSK